MRKIRSIEKKEIPARKAGVFLVFYGISVSLRFSEKIFYKNKKIYYTDESNIICFIYEGIIFSPPPLKLLLLSFVIFLS